MSSILNEEPTDLNTTNHNVSPVLERIVHHCLEKNPQGRFHSASDVAFDLQHLSAGSTGSSPVSKGVVQPRRIRWTGLAAAVLVLLALGLGWWLRGRDIRISHPEYQLITFRKGLPGNARFSPDGNVLYNAAWEGGEHGIYLGRPGDPISHEVGVKEGDLLAVSSSGELAVRLRSRGIGGVMEAGTLARIAAGSGTPREVLDNVADADWSPSGENLAVARYLPESGHWRLEYPIGRCCSKASIGRTKSEFLPTENGSLLQITKTVLATTRGRSR